MKREKYRVDKTPIKLGHPSIKAISLFIIVASMIMNYPNTIMDSLWIIVLVGIVDRHYKYRVNELEARIDELENEVYED